MWAWNRSTTFFNDIICTQRITRAQTVLQILRNRTVVFTPEDLNSIFLISQSLNRVFLYDFPPESTSSRLNPLLRGGWVTPRDGLWQSDGIWLHSNLDSKLFFFSFLLTVMYDMLRRDFYLRLKLINSSSWCKGKILFNKMLLLSLIRYLYLGRFQLVIKKKSNAPTRSTDLCVCCVFFGHPGTCREDLLTFIGRSSHQRRPLSDIP